MNLKNKNKLLDIFLITSSLGIILIGVSLIPIAKKASYWNKCFSTTYNWLNEKEKKVYEWERDAKESLSVAICNGAVHEPKFRKDK